MHRKGMSPGGRRMLFAGLSLLITSALPAAAANNNTANSGQIETVVVTAQKQAQNLQHVPIAVSVLTGSELAKANVVNVKQLANMLPNVQINSFTNSSDSAVFSIRGIGENDADPYVGSTVSVVQDGAVIGLNMDALVSLFDVKRIEVLRGPQGTLFGANTTGGVINIITNQPTGKFGGHAQISYGNYNELDADVTENFPITDKLAGKITILHSGNDGYFHDLVTHVNLGRKDVTALRTYLKYTSGNYDATLIAEYDRVRNGSQTSVNYSDPSQLGFDPGVTNTGKIQFIRSQNNIPDQDYNDAYIVTLTQHLNSTPIGNLISITNFISSFRDLYSNDGALPYIFIDTHRTINYHQYSEELRDSVRFNKRVHMMAGVFAFYHHYFLHQFGQLDGFLKGLGQPQTQNQSSYSLSAFGQIYVDITKKLHFQAGLRFEHERKMATSTTADTFTSTPGGYSTFCQPCASNPYIPGTLIVAGGAKSWDNLGAKIGLSYDWTKNIMSYGYYARGYKNGGFTGRIAFAKDIGPFNPEFVNTFEVGTKSELFDRHMRADLAMFYNIYDNMQVVQNITYPNGTNSASITNAGGATTAGFELATISNIWSGLQLKANLAYLDAHYTQYNTEHLVGVNLVPISYAGNRLMNAPMWNYSVGVNYDVAMAKGDTDFYVEDSFTSSKYTNFDDLPQEKVGSINLVNANITWTPNNGRWSVGVYGSNLFDIRYYGQKLYLPGTFAIASIGAPREFGIQFRTRW